MVRATVASYGKSENDVDFIEVVIHENDGKIIKSKVIKWSGDADKDSDEIMNFCSDENIKEIHTINQVLNAEQCECGEWIKRVVTDSDLKRNEPRKFEIKNKQDAKKAMKILMKNAFNNLKEGFIELNKNNVSFEQSVILLKNQIKEDIKDELGIKVYYEILKYFEEYHKEKLSLKRSIKEIGRLVNF